MTHIAQAIRSHREQARNRRALEHALANATSPSARADLVSAIQRSRRAGV